MEEGLNTNLLQQGGGWGVLIGSGLLFVGGAEIGGSICCLGLILTALGSIHHFQSSNENGGKMVLKQDASGQWKWANEELELPNAITEGSVNDSTQPASFAFNNQQNQTLSRIIAQVRGGKPLEQLESSELTTLSQAYGVSGNTDERRIEGLMSSEMARKGLKIAAATTGVAAVLGGTSVIARAKKEAEKKAKDAAEKAKKDAEMAARKAAQDAKGVAEAKIKNASESAKQRVDLIPGMDSDALVEQMVTKIKENNITPSKLIEYADFNKDGKLDAIELSGALTAILGVSIPAFAVKMAIGDMDKDGDGVLDRGEIEDLWLKLGLEIDEPEPINEDITVDEEIDQMMDEIDEEVMIEEPESIEIEVEVDDSGQITLAEDDVSEELPEEPIQEEIVSEEMLLTEGIDTELERMILQLEETRLTSERNAIIGEGSKTFSLHLRIEKVERTLLGQTGYRGGQSLHGMIDGGPYHGVIQIHTDLDEQTLDYKVGDEIQLLAHIVDYKPSIKRTVMRCDSIQG